MTSEEIIAMPSGREMDAIVSERVMGIAPRMIRLCGSTDQVEIWANSAFYRDGVCNRHDLSHVVNPPDYSSNIGLAMDVLCKVRGEERREFTINSKGSDYACIIFRPAVTGQGATISEAICRMALLTTVAGER